MSIMTLTLWSHLNSSQVDRVLHSDGTTTAFIVFVSHLKYTGL